MHGSQRVNSFPPPFDSTPSDLLHGPKFTFLSPTCSTLSTNMWTRFFLLCCYFCSFSLFLTWCVFNHTFLWSDFVCFFVLLCFFYLLCVNLIYINLKLLYFNVICGCGLFCVKSFSFVQQFQCCLVLWLPLCSSCDFSFSKSVFFLIWMYKGKNSYRTMEWHKNYTLVRF